MIRKAKGENLNKIMMRDVEFLKALNNCEEIKEENLEDFNMTQNRISKMIWDCYIEKKIDKDGNSYYCITEEGRNILSE